MAHVVATLILYISIYMTKAQYWEDEIKLKKPTGPPKICGKPADIIFIIDGSSSIWNVDFHKQLNFIRDVINEFNIDKDGSGARIGAIQYSNPWRTRIQFNLNEHFDQKELLGNLKRIKQVRGGTYTQVAIRTSRLQMFTKEAGARIDDPNIPQIAIVLTDGESWWPEMTAKEAQKAKEAGIRMMAIGIGYKVNIKEIHAIASEPLSKNAFTVSGYSALKDIKEELAIKACEIKPPVHEWTNCGKDLRSDVAFVLGEGNTVNEKELKKSLHFVRKITSKFNVGDEHLKVALVPTECEAPGFHFNKYNKKEEIYNHLDNARMTDRTTAGRIKYVTEKTFSPENGARRDARKLAFIIMNSNSKNKVASIIAAKEAQRKGIEIVVLAVGNKVRPGELYGMATSRSRVIRVPHYRRVPIKIKKLIYRLICKGNPLGQLLADARAKKTNAKSDPTGAKKSSTKSDKKDKLLYIKKSKKLNQIKRLRQNRIRHS